VKNSITSSIPEATIGLDLSDRTAQYCEINAAGEIVEEGKLKLDRVNLRRFLAAQPAGARIALETGTHAAWVSALITECGHESVVANARDLAAVTDRSNRDDRRDARQLARLARVDPELLHPVRLRDSATQVDLFVIRSRAALVEARTKLVNFARGLTKASGHRLPSCDAHGFEERVRTAVPEALRPALFPVLDVIEKLSAAIEEHDQKIEALSTKRYPETRWLKQVPGVGTLTALTFVLTIADPERVAHSRDVGPLLGLVPERRQSGKQDPHLRISKCGDKYLRRLLVQCAHVLMGRHGRDCALRQWALEHAKRSRTAKKRTVVAVARKLGVLLHRLWRRKEVLRPFPPAIAA
jgi:transposase